jgi:FkbM family methyltransferase
MNLIYKLVDKFLMNDFSKTISKIVNNNSKDELTVFDVGCFQGNFSRSLQKEIKKKTKYFLFDPNPNLEIGDFQYHKLAFSNDKGSKKFYLNTFFPASGSSLNTIHVKDKLWNFTRKLITGNLKKQFESFDVRTDTIDNFCKERSIDFIDILKIDTEGSEIEVLEGAKDMLNKTNIISIEVLDERKKFEEKYERVTGILEKNYNFSKVLEKRIWSLGTLSNMKAMDILFKK